MIAVILVIIGIAAAFALGVVVSYMLMDEADEYEAWEDEENER